ncbi:MAG TPA: hypothetical protein VK972_10915, partial [Wenzhouxiangella sp.]|nr:hypothetical protein [Wenzhouxiangella sp.]
MGAFLRQTADAIDENPVNQLQQKRRQNNGESLDGPTGKARLGGLSWQITDSFPEREEAQDFFDLGTAGQVAPKSPAQLGGGGFVIDGGTEALPFRPGSVGREDFCRHRQ